VSRAEFAGKRVAVIGLGVSGVAMCEAAVEVGATPIAFDEKPSDVQRVMEAADRLQAKGIEVVTGWHGELEGDFDWVLVSPGLPPGHPVMSAWAGKIMGEIEFAYRIAEAPILAITGTNGKSTTTVMLYKCLQDHGAVLCGNIAGSGYPEHVLTEAALTTPADGVLVAEISSAQLETVIDWCPRVATITNITEDHQDRYRSFEKYKTAKLNMFRNMGEGQVIVLNLDEESLDLELAGSVGFIGFCPDGGSGENAQTRRTDDALWFSGEEVKFVDLPFIGEMNFANAMTAWEMACAYVGEPTMGMLRRLLEFRPLENRMEPLGARDGVQVVNNSMCTNPMAVVKSCESLPQKLHILMGGNTKEGDYSSLQKYLHIAGHKVYLYGDDSGYLNSLLGGGYPEYSDLRSAFVDAVSVAEFGEVVMLAPGCASSGPYANFKERGSAFKQIAKEWLEDEEIRKS
jgi:UDP-N-acetylmuramoylalanine--D-glutamate ligase